MTEEPEKRQVISGSSLFLRFKYALILGAKGIAAFLTPVSFNEKAVIVFSVSISASAEPLSQVTSFLIQRVTGVENAVSPEMVHHLGRAIAVSYFFLRLMNKGNPLTLAIFSEFEKQKNPALIPKGSTLAEAQQKLEQEYPLEARHIHYTNPYEEDFSKALAAVPFRLKFNPAFWSSIAYAYNNHLNGNPARLGNPYGSDYLVNLPRGLLKNSETGEIFLWDASQHENFHSITRLRRTGNPEKIDRNWQEIGAYSYAAIQTIKKFGLVKYFEYEKTDSPRKCFVHLDYFCLPAYLRVLKEAQQGKLPATETDILNYASRLADQYALTRSEEKSILEDIEFSTSKSMFNATLSGNLLRKSHYPEHIQALNRHLALHGKNPISVIQAASIFDEWEQSAYIKLGPGLPLRLPRSSVELAATIDERAAELLQKQQGAISEMRGAIARFDPEGLQKAAVNLCFWNTIQECRIEELRDTPRGADLALLEKAESDRFKKQFAAYKAWEKDDKIALKQGLYDKDKGLFSRQVEGVRNALPDLDDLPPLEALKKLAAKPKIVWPNVFSK